MIYLASPYTHPDPAVREDRFLLACRVAGLLVKKGLHPYSPIAHCHPIVTFYGDMGTDFAYWKEHNLNFLRRADGFLVLTIPGWLDSIGVAQECDIATQLGIPYGQVNEQGEIKWQ